MGKVVVAFIAVALFSCVQVVCADEVVGHWEAHGVASTTTADKAVVIDAKADLLKTVGGGKLNIHVQSANSAVLDNARGCVIVSLLSASKEVSSYTACPGEMNPPRPLFGAATIRWGDGGGSVPSGIKVDGVAFKFYNAEHQGGPIDISPLIGIVGGILL